MTSKTCMELLLALGRCKSLTTLNMTANCIQGCLAWFLPHPHSGLLSLGKVFLDSTSLNGEDMSHLVQLIEKRKLPMLEELNLGSNALHTMEDIVENFVEACVTHHATDLKVNVCDNYLSYSLKDKCKSLCDGTCIKLFGITHLIDLAWTEDEFLEGFYEDQDVEIDDDDEESVRDDNEENAIYNDNDEDS